MAEHVLQDHAASLHGYELGEARDRRARRLIAREQFFGIVRFARRRIARGVEGLAHATIVAPKVVERAVVGDLEEPGTKRRYGFELGKRVVRPSEGLLHDVLSVGDRSRHARAVAMQVRSQLGHELEKAAPCVVQGRNEGILLSSHRRPQASSETMPRSPFMPNATPFA